MEVKNIALGILLLGSTVVFGSEKPKSSVGKDLVNCQVLKRVHNSVLRPYAHDRGVSCRDGFSAARSLSLPGKADAFHLAQTTGLQAFVLASVLNSPTVRGYLPHSVNAIMKNVDFDSYVRHNIFYAPLRTSNVTDAAVNHVVVPAIHSIINHVRKNGIGSSDMELADTPTESTKKLKFTITDVVKITTKNSFQGMVVAAFVKVVPAMLASGRDGISSGDVRVFGISWAMEYINHLLGNMDSAFGYSTKVNPWIAKAGAIAAAIAMSYAGGFVAAQLA